jgi:hypothetical protein
VTSVRSHDISLRQVFQGQASAARVSLPAALERQITLGPQNVPILISTTVAGMYLEPGFSAHGNGSRI